jgi:CRP/FNR family transcriptional regulator
VIAAGTLEKLAPFDGVPGAVVATLASRGVLVRYPAERVIFAAGGVPRGWYVVIEGRVRVVRGSGSRQHVIHTEGPGGTLAEVPLFAGGTHPATAIAAEPTTCALFTLKVIRAAMAESEDVSLMLLRRLALRVRGLVNRLDERSAQSVRARLIDFLVQRAASTRNGTFSIGMTQQRLAEELGTVREVASRELRELRRAGIVESLGGGRYRLLT